MAPSSSFSPLEKLEYDLAHPYPDFVVLSFCFAESKSRVKFIEGTCGNSSEGTQSMEATRGGT